MNQAQGHGHAGDAAQVPLMTYQPGAPGMAPGAANPHAGAAGVAQWMPRPQVPNCPPGLEYLALVDQMLVQQKVELLEAFTGFETKNKYVIKNTVGQQVYYAAEESDGCQRFFCGNRRAFTMHILDNNGQEVIRVNRPFDFCPGMYCTSLCSCCADQVNIEAPPGQLIGSVYQMPSICIPTYAIRNAQNETILTIKRRCCNCKCFGDQEFPIYGTDQDNPIGKISKKWSGLAKEMFTDADNFGVQFPMDLDVKLKACIIGGVFLIDFMFFEDNDKRNNHH